MKCIPNSLDAIYLSNHFLRWESWRAGILSEIYHNPSMPILHWPTSYQIQGGKGKAKQAQTVDVKVDAFLA